jgi:hypothetical protein
MDSAMESVRSGDSITHGPAINNGFSPSPTRNDPMDAKTATTLSRAQALT